MGDIRGIDIGKEGKGESRTGNGSTYKTEIGNIETNVKSRKRTGTQEKVKQYVIPSTKYL